MFKKIEIFNKFTSSAIKGRVLEINIFEFYRTAFIKYEN